MIGTAIFTEKTQEELIEILKGEDATFAPFGSGGYEIRARGGGEGATVISFTQCDMAPARTFVAAIEGGVIYGNRIIPEIMKILISRNVPFNASSETEIPSHITSFLGKKRQ